MQIRSILCPVDFSEYSRHALDHAVAVARRFGSRITALHVFPNLPVITAGATLPPYVPIGLADEDRECVERDLQRFVDAESAPGVCLATLLREGHPMTEILRAASDVHADLLVMGTHGRSGFDRLLLGSVTERVLRKAACPVLTVPARHPDSVPSSPALFREILCPVDFSEPSMRALKYALELAQETDANLTVMHVVQHDMFTAPGYDESLSVAAYLASREGEAMDLLKEAVSGPAQAYCRAETFVTRGTPKVETLRLAAERKSDLIVIGVQGRGAVDLTLFGSTTQHVLRQATCPVLTMRR